MEREVARLRKGRLHGDIAVASLEAPPAECMTYDNGIGLRAKSAIAICIRISDYARPKNTEVDHDDGNDREGANDRRYLRTPGRQVPSRSRASVIVGLCIPSERSQTI